MTKHTHEEYLAWIDKQIAQRKKIYASIERNSPKVPDPLVEFHDVGIASLLANRAVLVRHVEHQACSDGCLVSGWCNQCMEPPFPCPSRTDITDQLEKVMGGE